MAEKINNYENTNRLFDKAANLIDLDEEGSSPATTPTMCRRKWLSRRPTRR